MADALTRPTPLALATAPPAYDRARWGDAVLSGSLHPNARLLALVLAHLAGPSGSLPAGGSHGAQRLAPQAGISERLTRISLNVLENEGYLTRPDIHTWQPEELLRPITLTLPSRAGAREEPPHTGESR